MALSTDAHRIGELDYMHFAIGQARRGWLGAEDVLNTMTWAKLKKLMKRK